MIDRTQDFVAVGLMAGIILPAHVNFGGGDIGHLLIRRLGRRQRNGHAGDVRVARVPRRIVGAQAIIEGIAWR